MSDHYQARARALVVTGLAINVVATLADLANVYGSGMHKYLRFSGMFGIYLSPLGALSAAGAWWFLTKMSAESTTQRSLLERAMYWFALEVLLGVVASVNVGWHQSITTWTGSIIWFMGIGGAIEAVGLVALARVFGATTFGDRESQEPSAD
jgi:hypothetical protein